jgi:hypothetical protein
LQHVANAEVQDKLFEKAASPGNNSGRARDEGLLCASDIGGVCSERLYWLHCGDYDIS